MSPTEKLTAKKFEKCLFPARFDELVRDFPDKVTLSIPIDDHAPEKGWKDITFRQCSVAVDRLCEWLEPRVGKNPTKDSSYIAIVTTAIDPRCVWIALALQKLGHTALYSAPRNTIPMHHNLFDKNDVDTLIVGGTAKPEAVTGDREMTVFRMPEMSELMMDGPMPKHYPYEGDWETEKDKSLAVVHTSGSTGMPKPRYILHRYLAHMAQTLFIPPVNGVPLLLDDGLSAGRIYVGIPPYHVAGLCFAGIIMSFVRTSSVMVFGPAHLPPFGPTARDVLRYGNVDATFANPSIIMDLSNDEKDLKLLGTQKFIYFGGGAVDKASGDRVAKYTHLQTFMSATETFIQGVQLANQPEDYDLWDYFHFSPEHLHKGMRFEEVTPGVYEQVLFKTDDTLLFNPVFSHFPDKTEYRTSDTFIRHPTRENLYRFEGRTDDLIAFASGAKYSPFAYEETLLAHPLVRSAIMVGIRKPCAGLLLELTDPSVPADEAIERIWPTVEKANAAAPKHAFVRKPMVMVASQEKPFVRAGKETVIRGQTLMAYEREIDAHYNQWGDNWLLRN